MCFLVCLHKILLWKLECISQSTAISINARSPPMMIISNLQPIWIEASPPVPGKLGTPHCTHSYTWKGKRAPQDWTGMATDPEEPWTETLEGYHPPWNHFIRLVLSRWQLTKALEPNNFSLLANKGKFQRCCLSGSKWTVIRDFWRRKWIFPHFISELHLWPSASYV